MHSKRDSFALKSASFLLNKNPYELSEQTTAKNRASVLKKTNEKQSSSTSKSMKKNLHFSSIDQRESPSNSTRTTDSGSSKKKRTKTPDLVDLNKIINEKVKKFKDDSFIYLTYTEPKSSEFFTPYSLMEVPFEKVDRNQYYTISRHGVTFWSRTENHFTRLSEWQSEYALYKSLIEIKAFKKFRIWKGFKVWQKSIQWKKLSDAKKILEENLFVATPPLGRALIQLQSQLQALAANKFVDCESIENWDLFKFVERQTEVFNQVNESLNAFRSNIESVLYAACYKSMIENNFLPTDEALLYTTPKKMKENFSFIDRAKKRRYCIMLTKFLSCCDYMTIGCIYNIVKNTFSEFATVFRVNDFCGPTVEELRENLDTNVELERPRPDDDPKNPFIMAQLQLKPASIDIDPSEEVTLNTIIKFNEMILDAAFNFERFQNSEKFKQFTEPSIMGKQEDKLGGNPPSLAFLFDIDDDYKKDRNDITAIIKTAFNKINVYIERFEPIVHNFATDLRTTPANISEEKNADNLRRFCERYHKEIDSLDEILPIINLGLIKLSQGTFKKEIIPVCQNLLEILNVHLPALAIYRVIDVIDKLKESLARLQTVPEGTSQFVNYLKYIDGCSEKIDKIEDELKYAHQIFVLMKDFKVMVDDLEKERYLDTEELVGEVKVVLQQKLNQKPELVQKLSDCIQDDIKLIFVEVDEVAEKILEPWLLLEHSDRAAVKETLQNHLDRLQTCQSTAQDFQKYQKEFRIDLTRFDKLDTTLQETKNRQLLWSSVDEWNECFAEWQAKDFHQIDLEEMTQGNAKLVKNCKLLEKYLPPNRVTPKLKESVEKFKQKLPTIGYLRNPNLKARHWVRIEQILNYKFLPDEISTIKTFESIGAFNESLTNEIMEVTGQASAENGLELVLKKVENSWKSLELSIVTHRDAKDIFILAGIDEIQMTLDESLMNINTIAASRNVGPIKSRVEEWQRGLLLFGVVLDEWVKCQQTWIYLEAIFSAPDIQRQLPNEARMFLVVDKSWKEIMRKTYKVPLALPAMTEPGILEQFQTNNMMLEKILQCLETYLEIKRVAFPRFYFLSNDELLEILAETRNPHTVQPHLRKCFDAIYRLEFGVIKNKDGPDTLTNEILKMISPEGESIEFNRGLKARGSVEDWLAKVEEAMVTALKRSMRYAFRLYPVQDRSEWFKNHANQIVLTVSQQQWATDVHAILDDPQNIDKGKLDKMVAFDQKLKRDLSKLAAIARSDIPSLVRKVLCALITIDVHAKDTVLNMVEKKVTKSNDFNWLKMLRYYWDPVTETMITRMTSSSLPYYYEYLGAGGVLVITPLTDRCYLCLMGALQMDLGGAPAGPAGTGKTETTKDLAKSLAKQCVVFNCSEGLDYKMMGRFFSGLAQSGAWCCFDEFNRIDIEVLSVIAQQLITIQAAKSMRQKRFMFEGREIKLNQSCAAFITMNPGYAGRTELPDNLKALFRPISMMVPDYALIAEVILYSEGFENSKLLAQKMVEMYKLCSEQLSQQDHYDFGMRAVKSVLVMAGALKRAAPNQNEDFTLIAALRDSNIPKFLREDAKLFRGILGDLFPGVELPVVESTQLQPAIVSAMTDRNLQPVPEMVTKTVQLFETMCVRWGVMLVGLTASGKTSVLHTLAAALTKLDEDQVLGPQFRKVRLQTLNPKAISIDELYGTVNSQTLEWNDGLLGKAVRSAVNVQHEEHQWIVCDGPIDAVWIENMNTVLDDNKMLCLANSERIKLTEWVHLVFEVQDLSQASPATVSRCGMVYVDPNDLGWIPLLKSWMKTLSVNPNELNIYISSLFHEKLEDILRFTRNNGKFAIHQVEASKISLIFTLFDGLLKQAGNLGSIDYEEAEKFITNLFVWTVLWSIGSNLLEKSRENLEENIRENFKNTSIELPTESLWNFYLNPKSKDWEKWDLLVPSFQFNKEMPYFDILVPTIDSVRIEYVASLLLNKKRHVMLTGDTGVGKSVVAKSVLTELSKDKLIAALLNFSAQTSSKKTQETIEGRLEKRKKTLLGPPIGKTLTFFIDDINMPELDRYGSQPTIEMLRQLIDFMGLYDRENMYWKDVIDVVLSAACAPPGGGRNPLSARFVRHFALIHLSSPNTDTLTTIFSAIMNGFLDDFVALIRPLAHPIIKAAISIYDQISRELLPTPAKSHYVFNLRDLSKCVQGICQANPISYTTPQHITRLFYHESLRVFQDRMINDEDKHFFEKLMGTICLVNFDDPIVRPNETLLYGDFMMIGQSREERLYEEIRDVEKLKSILMDYMDDYNTFSGNKMHLILFQDAIEHILRLSRILRAERGNGLLVGLSGMGKQSLSRLAANINGYKIFQLELCRGYDRSNFHDDLRSIFWTAGVTNVPTVFLMTDTQIVREEFLEDINQILNSGEVPDLFEGEELERLINGAQEMCAANKTRDCSRDGVYAYVIGRVRANLHVMLCMSPVGDSFRRRCRMFPSLVNCCTIDWFVKWPPEALHSVALGVLHEISDNEDHCENVARICVMMHESVEELSAQFYREMRRYYYTTPSSYLELLRLYRGILKNQGELIIARRTRIANGLNKILESNELVNVMGEELTRFQPILEAQAERMKELLSKMEEDTQAVDIVRATVAKDEAEANVKKDETLAISEDANRDLQIAMPSLRAAEDALKAINKSDINELRSFASPPKLVQFVMEPVSILLGSTKPDWAAAKTLMSDANFLKKLVEFDKEHISDAVLTKLKTYINHKDFDPSKVEKVSKVAKSMCLWVRAMDDFAKIYRVVEPKIKRHKEAEIELKKIMQVLKQKQNELAEVEEKIQTLKDTIEMKSREFKDLQDTVDLTSNRLNRAGRLTSALSDEEIRWKKSVEDLTEELWAIPGDTLVAAACVAYLGAFPITYRSLVSVAWVDECHKYSIPSSATFKFVKVLGDPYKIRGWNMFGLPKDDISTENGIIVQRASRWPLIIDPQEQANQWIRNMEKENGLKVMKMSDPGLSKILEMCIRQGLPLMIEELGESIDPSLGPILSRNIILKAGRPIVRLGDTEVDYDENFKLYMTTKLSNPHYLPEICIQVTLVNFLVSPMGLEDQLLGEVVAIELPQLERQRNDLIVRINNDRRELVNLEDKVLKLLFSSEGNILDDEELVETLNEAKETSAIIASRLIDTVETETTITVKREKYRPLAIRGANLYFVVASLAEIDTMYQNSLAYFTQIFSAVVKANQKEQTLEMRLKYLMEAVTYAVYQNVSRGLFEKHKLVYGFLLAVSVLKEQGLVSHDEYEFLLRGPIDTRIEFPAKPDEDISDLQWKSCCLLDNGFRNFDGICRDVVRKITVKLGDFKYESSFSSSTESATQNWSDKLTPFQKLILLNIVNSSKMVIAIGAFICETIGQRFTEVPRNNTLTDLYNESTATTPLVFILSSGSDPMSSLLRLADSINMRTKLLSISLGQGQGPAAQTMIEKGRAHGNWIYLQNCHLATSWMASMERIVRDITLGVVTVHPDFRLFLSSVPTRTFPTSVLQNSLKITNEPPKGIRANLMRSLAEIEPDFFEHHVQGSAWRRMVFGLCMFHAIVLERRKFGPLGWNIEYDFSDSDRECGLKVLETFCDREIYDQIPWDSVEYINGEVTWGGRVTDAWDLKCLKTILTVFSSPKILAEEYTYSLNGIYRCPEGKKLQEFKEFAAGLPFVDDPEIFGMHSNANVAFEGKETAFILETLLETSQMAGQSTDSMTSNDEICLGLIDKISSLLARKISTDEMMPGLTDLDDKGRVPSLTTVLLQEVDRFNNLLAVVHSNLDNLKKAIRGFVVMSEHLEAIFNTFLNNRVPVTWINRGFLSTKPLGSWIVDFQHRIDFIQTWVKQGPPISTWISGLYFPQSFLTGMLQKHARTYNQPIDSLKIDFEILAERVSQQEIFEKATSDLYKGLNHPEVGAYIHGLFIESGRWDDDLGLIDSQFGELLSTLPVVWLKPCSTLNISGRYEAPLYKTQVRAGTLSTTGHSTNFVLSILLDTDKSPDFWTLRGTALFTMD